MKCLFYFYSCFNPTFMGGLLDDAIELAQNKDNEVLFVYCGGLNSMCFFNREGSKKLCDFCSYATHKVIEQYGIKTQPLTKYTSNCKVEKLQYNNAKELRSLTYRGVNVGLGFMSGFISATRNMNPLINNATKPFFDAHMDQMVRMVDSVYNLIESFGPDVIYTFNGRYEEVRAIFDISQVLGINCIMTEAFPREGKWAKVQFENHLPHDIKYWVSRRDFSWDNYQMSEEEKIILGHSFYNNRRNGIYAGDKIYTKDQVQGSLPNIDKSKINIGIMNSSEDEYAAVGADWDSLKFFPTQNEGIIWLLENADPNVHFFLRIHPNLKNIPYKFHTDLLKLEERFSNVTVIPGNSVISTYTLLDHMDKIVVFGSTMGIESVYWKVPTINLGPALYSYDNICYEPKNLDDLKQMLVDKLKPKYNEAVIKYGAFSMNQDPVIIPTRYLDFQSTTRKLFAIPYKTFPYINFLLGEKITGLFIAIMRQILGIKVFRRFNLPKEEE